MSTGLLASKTALVTNVGSSLGFSIAQRLGLAGAHLFICDSNDESLRNSLSKLKIDCGKNVFGIVADVHRKDHRKQLFDEIQQELSHLDIMVVTNPPNKTICDILESTSMDLDLVYDTYLTTPFRLCQSAMPLLEKSSNGSIVLMSSMAGFNSFRDIGLYSAAQTSLLGLCKGLAFATAKKGVRVNSVSLGMFKKDGSGGFWSTCEDPEAVQQVNNLIPLGRIAQNSDCTGLVEFLVSDRAKYITEILKSEFKPEYGVEVAAVLKARSTTYSAPDVPHPFRQCSYFRYLSGITSPDCKLIVRSRGSTLFVPELSKNDELWHGKAPTLDELKAISGVDEILSLNQFEPYLASCSQRAILCMELNQFKDDQVILEAYGKQAKRGGSTLFKLLDQLRWIKSQNEIELMRETCKIGSNTMNSMMKHSKFTPNENHIVGLLEYEARRRGAGSLAYPPVVAAGNRANTIHYIESNQEIAPSDCILVDAGCDLHGYVSDITRTFPVSGKFSNPQRILYEALSEVQTELLEYVNERRPLKLNELYFYMCECLASKFKEISIFKDQYMSDEKILMEVDNICPHHVSHYLGMDVHDTASVSRAIPIPSNVIITVEPGIYIPPNYNLVRDEFKGIGMRIEDDVLIDETGSEVLTRDCVREAYYIEELMKLG
uniref:Aminopeptidase P N-terminal domain-containing protein n=1 Tax=Acrobeloides nanus TaxID=290746 RepID=A0A914CY05_9BILA